MAQQICVSGSDSSASVDEVLKIKEEAEEEEEEEDLMKKMTDIIQGCTFYFLMIFMLQPIDSDSYSDRK